MLLSIYRIIQMIENFSDSMTELTFCLIGLKVTDIWHEHLHRIVKIRTKAPSTPRGIGPTAEDPDEAEDCLGKLSGRNKYFPISIYEPPCEWTGYYKVPSRTTVIYEIFYIHVLSVCSGVNISIQKLIRKVTISPCWHTCDRTGFAMSYHIRFSLQQQNVESWCCQLFSLFVFECDNCQWIDHSNNWLLLTCRARAVWRFVGRLRSCYESDVPEILKKKLTGGC